MFKIIRRHFLRGRKEINALTVPENPSCQAALITGDDSIIPFRVLSEAAGLAGD
jgi:hypothetical protein